MLVLTRKTLEKITIGDNITVTILQVKGRTVRIGIEAPKAVRVLRAEIPSNEFAEDSLVPSAAGRPEADARPAAAEAAMCESEIESLTLGRLECLEKLAGGRRAARSDRDATGFEPRATGDSPLGLHLARRFRIVAPQKFSSQQINQSVAASVAASLDAASPANVGSR